MKKLLCTLLVLMMALSVLPQEAAALGQTGTVTVSKYFGEKIGWSYTVTVGDEPVYLGTPGYVTVDGTIYEFVSYSNGYDSVLIPAYDGTAAWHKTWGQLAEVYELHKHEYLKSHNRRQHWKSCRCGKVIEKADHVDPATAENKTCTCGYQFSSNCDLTTLWLKNMNLTQRFDKKTTDYTAQVYTYLEVTDTAITATAMDALATVELPKDLSVKDGRNVYTVTVTAEDRTTTKTYTVTAVKPVKVGGILIASDAKTVSAEPKCTFSRRTATATVPDLLLEEMADLAAADGSTQIRLIPNFSKWAYDRIDVPLDCRALKAIADGSKADLFVQTHFGTVTIPHAELAALAEGRETVTISIEKETAIKLYGDGNEIRDFPKAIDRDLY